MLAQQKDLRDRMTAIASVRGSYTQNLYAVSDREGTVLCIVAAHRSEEALRHCQAIGLDWCLANTTTRRIQRNIESEEGVLTAVGMTGKASRFRMKMPC